ncbi:MULTISPECIES: phage baseplate assembly protein V [unclassified Burkholderia]|uniref:phage baseplate assembly protein V n=1 Tax=unclassified Burkholderia TaxID=2613784 RepID=UPI001423F80E|nr:MULTISPECIES: phage baseplate assembly protein V [unclassified Burkholderia]NIE58646.1 hypothetical protein [Burkholderia sp. Ap-955]NIF10153.1 hypothetical protein [Burkholderia sp. Ax-1735]NIG03604.1 hypothetical protein [Burkholderia sp. Tr-849]
MATNFLEWAGEALSKKESGYSVAPAVVSDNTNLLLDGRVQVRIPSLPELDVWARPVSVGGGAGRGFMWLPEIEDEVLVAFNQNDARDAYLLGGLWNTLDRPPTKLPPNPLDFTTKRILQTGVAGGIGHNITFDDAKQSITITSSTFQTVTIDPKKIDISTAGGAISITLDLGATPPGITLQTLGGNITLKAPAGKISLQGAQVEVQATAKATLSAKGDCTIKGGMVFINPPGP